MMEDTLAASTGFDNAAVDIPPDIIDAALEDEEEDDEVTAPLWTPCDAAAEVAAATPLPLESG